jgi:Skp family chaperone for outer membrane proteins
MRRTLAVVASLPFLALAGAQGAQIGVVNMERLIQMHPRTEQNRATLERYVKDFDAERDERLEALREMSQAFETLRQEAEDIGLAADAARERRQRAQLKLEELRRAEGALRELAATRQQELTKQEMRLREQVVRDIKRALREVADERNLDLILDGGEDPAGGYGAVIFSRAPFDLTDTVILKLRAGVAETPAER